jgi:hypothetical protein
MPLYLHAGATPITRQELGDIAAPPATNTWCPLHHYDFATSIIDTLNFMGARITDEKYGIKHGETDGDEFFGLIEFEHDKLDIPVGTTLGLGIRNSWTKKFPVSGILSKHTTVCDNRAFAGIEAFQFKRKNSPSLSRELPSITAGAMMNFLRSADEYLLDSARMDEYYLNEYVQVVHDSITVDHIVMQLAIHEAISWKNIRNLRDEILRPDGPGGFFPRNGRDIHFGDVMQGVTEVEKSSLNPISTPERMSRAHNTIMSMIDDRE